MTMTKTCTKIGEGKALKSYQKSLNQIHREIENARAEALRDPRINEVSNVTVFDEKGYPTNPLTDFMTYKRSNQQEGTQLIDPVLLAKIDKMFTKYQHQYKVLGLHYSGGFTVEEIAVDEKTTKGHISRSISRAKQRMQKYLSEAEYDSIRWYIGDREPIQVTAPVPDEMKRRIADYKLMKKSLEAGLPHTPIKFKEREYEGDKSKYINFQSKPIGDPILGLHPPEKHLPVPQQEVHNNDSF
ncbi:hypothetical protein [Paenibacillus sp. V4I7]|uniref:hypothetical protein n=1 Tax=Paenibacillus sp. V4I7 TaxID=3042307 RepID=UPI0027879435|nr:hypothetical protein [Paenibacillus sp. V4I7]MDQ0898438.1 putative DNA-binding protein YlxM (UPF0122 family) [Paenibacillus sp. V4I7]